MTSVHALPHQRRRRRCDAFEGYSFAKAANFGFLPCDLECFVFHVAHSLKLARDRVSAEHTFPLICLELDPRAGASPLSLCCDGRRHCGFPLRYIWESQAVKWPRGAERSGIQASKLVDRIRACGAPCRRAPFIRALRVRTTEDDGRRSSFAIRREILNQRQLRSKVEMDTSLSHQPVVCPVS